MTEKRKAASRNGRRKAPAARTGLLKDQAYEQIKRLIQSGDFAPGLFLSERQLSDQLGMSKTPIRAALERLEGQGLVAVSPQQGIVVRDLSLQETVELFELRTAIEPYVVRRLAGRLAPPQQERLRGSLEEQRLAVERGDPAACAECDVEFHLLLCELLGNREIESLLRRAFDKLYRAIVRINSHSPGRLAASAEEHSRVAEAILAGKPDLAAKRMEEHLAFGRQFLLTGV